MSFLRKDPKIIDQNIDSFLQEIKDIGSENPKIFAFGNDAYNILDMILNKNFTLYKLRHYSNYESKEAYRQHLISQFNNTNK